MKLQMVGVSVTISVKIKLLWTISCWYAIYGLCAVKHVSKLDSIGNKNWWQRVVIVIPALSSSRFTYRIMAYKFYIKFTCVKVFLVQSNLNWGRSAWYLS
jgi:hypothetical protein